MTSTSDPTPERPPSERPEPDPVASASRDARRKRRLPPDAACAICGETNPGLLRVSRGHLLEEDHVAGRDNDAQLVVVLCLNHHAVHSIDQLDAGVLTAEPMPTAIERIVLALQSVGLFFEEMAKACYRWAASLSQMVLVLDENVPGWRLLPGMP